MTIGERYVARHFPCWRWRVGVLEEQCQFTRCPFYTNEAPGQCKFNDPDREHSIGEISAVLRINERDAQRDLDSAVENARIQVVRGTVDLSM